MAHHFYAATCYGWATANTREKAIRKVASDAGEKMIANAMKARGGLLCFTVRVEAPESAEYKIEGYMPVGVETSERLTFRIVNSKGKTVPAPNL